MTIYYPVGYNGAVVAIEKLIVRPDWVKLDPEFARRVQALIVHGEGKLGFGGGWRSSAAQEALFRSRYHEDPQGHIFWNGVHWTIDPGVASAAPPGVSYHESTTAAGGALAVDLIGDLSILANDGPKFGLIEFGNVNGEPWHAQPMEIPHSRRDYDASNDEPLAPWIFPTPSPLPPIDPQPPTPAPGDDDEVSNVRFVRHTGYINVFMVGAGPVLSAPQELIDSFPADTPKIFYKDANLPALRSMCFQAGLDMNDPKQLIPGGVTDRF